jgi:integrase
VPASGFTPRNSSTSARIFSLSSCSSWAASGYRDKETLNPARWKGHLDKLLAKRSKARKAKNHAALHFDEVPDFMRKLRERDGVAALALEFAILTATRTSETLNATYDEIDLAGRTWTIPPERMKGGLLHRVPLSDRTVAIIEDMKSDKRGDYIFPGAKRGKPLSNMAMLLTLRRMGRGDLTTHGFRSSFRTWAAERGNFKREIAEKALAHLVGDETERAYDRGDLFEKRRRLMNVWATFCSTRGTAKMTGNVVGLRP